ncbi:reverse transcriptase [Fusarium flagelliforme]|uniref:Reverse transcriptase n=1 Tax=Fusarium flagelliforme TaxID=2675880 RepID=A0A395MB05_9HYPO|nr:reverse transcriptase [Fusarium flagelliforme]
MQALIREEQQAFKQMIEGQEKAIRRLQKDIQGIQAQAAQERKLMEEQIDELKRMRQHTSGDSEPLQSQAVDEIKRIHEKLDTLAQRAVPGSAQTNPRQSFADIARMSPTEGQDGGVRGPEAVSSPTPPLSSPGEDLFCTIDISGVGDDDSNKVQIGEVNGANRSAVLDSNDNLLSGASEALGQENEVTIAKMNWLSDKGNGKAYGSMVVYVTKESDARRLLEDKYFHLGGESARTSVFEPRAGVVQCYNCWGLGHKAFVCKETQRCGRCTERGHYHRQCEAAEPILQVYQLNVQKNDKVHLSMMNDQDLQGYAALAVAELNWTKMIPTKTREPRVSRWPIRSMLWIQRDLEAEQVPIPSPDLTAAIVRFPERDVLGDFNRHDTLWGGDEVTRRRQGEAGPTIELTGEHGLHSLLPRGTKTWEGPRGKTSTINLVLASTELADEMTSCGIHPTEHGSDHRAIRSEFDTTLPERTPSDRLLLKNAPWLKIKERVRTKLEALPCGGTVQAQTDRLMSVVLDAINDLVPRAKPSPYAKRWWTTDLTRLRRMYTYWRNQARAYRRRGREATDLEQKAREAAKEYHDAIRRQKKAHWDSFLENGANIWQ